MWARRIPDENTRTIAFRAVNYFRGRRRAEKDERTIRQEAGAGYRAEIADLRAALTCREGDLERAHERIRELEAKDTVKTSEEWLDAIAKAHQNGRDELAKETMDRFARFIKGRGVTF